MPQQWSQVDPYTAGSELAVDHSEVVDDVLRLYSIVCECVQGEKF